jgi:aldehyde dehydrogenase (NAD+)
VAPHRSDLIEDRGEEVVLRAAADNGQPLSFGAAFLESAAAWTRYYVGWADKIIGEATGSHSRTGSWVTRR